MSETGGGVARYGIIGWPVAHSRSPLIHNYWLQMRDTQAVYETVPIDPAVNFRAALEDMAHDGFAGANVTLPHKENAFAAMDDLSDTARRLGAVNTIDFAGGQLTGHNTDGGGFIAGLDAVGGDWRKASAAVLGAGGAARAILAALADAGVTDIRLSNRNRQRAESLAPLAGDAAQVTIYDWEARNEMLDGAGLLVNTTSLGMKDQPQLDIALSGLAASALVSDIVYTPLDTPLLAAARESGFKPVDGLGMLLHQAALASEIWFGERPPVTEELRQSVLADLGEI